MLPSPDFTSLNHYCIYVMKQDRIIQYDTIITSASSFSTQLMEAAWVDVLQ